MSSPKQKFKVGDRVAWSSQAGGHWKTKKGTIIKTIKSGIDPYFSEFYMNRGKTFGFSRNHRSFVVKSDNGQIYWPLVKNLRKI